MIASILRCLKHTAEKQEASLCPLLCAEKIEGQHIAIRKTPTE